jgi:hypothetical protein
MKWGLVVILLAIVFIAGCTEEVVVVTPVEKPVEVPEEVIEQPEEEIEEPEEEIEEPEEEQPEYLEDLCPEQVLLGFKKCSELEDGSFNVEIRNVAYADLISVAFYIYYEDEKVGEVEVKEEFIAGTEKSYPIDFPALEEEYGHIDKIEATPVIMDGNTVLRCANKKLSFPISSCR